MLKYNGQDHLLVAVDCIIFGFDEEGYKLLLIQRGFPPEEKKWSLMGGFVQKQESLEDAANRVLAQLTGLKDVYMEQMKVFGDLHRDPVERTIAVTYVALLDIEQYKQQLSHEFHARWFKPEDVPSLIFDHAQMVEKAKNWLRYKAALHPVLFELLPEKFTLPQIHALYEGLYQMRFDKRNFTKKVLSSGFLVKLQEKDKINSKKGAFFFRLNKAKYKKGFRTFRNLIPVPDNLQQ